MTIQQKTNALFEDQVARWPLLAANREKLEGALLKTFYFDGFSIRVQFNPRRIISSAAKVDRDSIRKRPCFLCPENRPPEETHVDFGGDYEILCNPFPIFRQHYTIAKVGHTPQMIDPELSRFLDLARALPELAVLYNAPSCGASAPDHMHFQAGTRGFMPIEDEIGTLADLYGEIMVRAEGFNVSSIRDGLRKFILLESDRKEPLEAVLLQISDFLRQVSEDGQPMMNILAYYEGKWQILVFPRAKHRPWQFFEEGERNIMLSPGSVDMGGTMITPMEKDFNKISRGDIEDIFAQISLSDESFSELTGLLKEKND